MSPLSAGAPGRSRYGTSDMPFQIHVSSGKDATVDLLNLCRSVMNSHEYIELIGFGESAHATVTLSEMLQYDATRISIQTSSVPEPYKVERKACCGIGLLIF